MIEKIDSIILKVRRVSEKVDIIVDYVGSLSSWLKSLPTIKDATNRKRDTD